MRSFVKYKLTVSGKKIGDREEAEQKKERDWALGLNK
jgi:hypothetical protein